MSLKITSSGYISQSHANAKFGAQSVGSQTTLHRLHEVYVDRSSHEEGKSRKEE